jgi:hypothetical protein
VVSVHPDQVVADADGGEGQDGDHEDGLALASLEVAVLLRTALFLPLVPGSLDLASPLIAACHASSEHR